MNLPVGELTAEAFRPYGTVIRKPDSGPVASGDGWQWWNEAALIPSPDGPFAVGFLALEPAASTFDWAEYHLQTPEVIIPLGHECLIYVGAPGPEPDWARFEVFRIREGEAVILDKGVWHGAPIAISQPASALVLLRQGTGEDDVFKATYPDGAITISNESSSRH